MNLYFRCIIGVSKVCFKYVLVYVNFIEIMSTMSFNLMCFERDRVLKLIFPLYCRTGFKISNFLKRLIVTTYYFYGPSFLVSSSSQCRLSRQFFMIFPNVAFLLLIALGIGKFSYGSRYIYTRNLNNKSTFGVSID